MSSQHRRRIAALLKLSGDGAGAPNERLEFFGDAVLGFVTARWLMAKYPDASEGELHRRKAAIVSGDACAQSARRLEMGEIVRLGVGAQQSGGAANASILADAFEAYVGALYLATDIERAGHFLEAHHIAHVDRAEAAEADAKTALQEFTQGRFGVAPIYFERAEGPAHDRRFTSQVRIADEVVGEGIGASKKAAQQSAAAMALATLRNRHPEPEPPAPAPPAASSSDGRVIALRPSRNKTKAP
jgi:ribonuclease-3